MTGMNAVEIRKGPIRQEGVNDKDLLLALIPYQPCISQLEFPQIWKGSVFSGSACYSLLSILGAPET